ncbi:MAG: methyl-accepting chemotaxis protein [bacterium]|nr:methyl-accepting chemotaxis protein [bacterium]
MKLPKSIKQWGLRGKLLFVAGIGIIMVSVILSIFFQIQMQKQTYSNLKRLGMSITAGIAYNSVSGVIIGNKSSLEKILKSVEKEEDVVYVIIQDESGKVLAQTQNGLEEKALNDQINLKAVQLAEPDTFYWKPDRSQRVIEVVVPIIMQEEEMDLGMDDMFGTPEKKGELKEQKIGVVRTGMTVKKVSSLIKKNILNTILLTTILIVVFILITSKLMRNLLKPLQELLMTVHEIENGNLSQYVESQSADEVGELAAGFSEMAASLLEMVKQIKENTKLIDESAASLLSSSEEQASSAEEQSSVLTTTMTTIEEFAATSRQIAENASTVADLARQTLDGMNIVKDNTNLEAKRIMTLGEKSQSIGKVVEMIEEIARETNLLALNASIEAARAGEAGKGFAVVATEIRKLATNVANSTKQIREIIKEIQDATNASILATEKVGKSVIDGMVQSEQTSTSAELISTATQQQRTASNQVVSTIKELTSIVKEVSIGASQITDTANMLVKLTAGQKKLVEKFKIE